MICLIMTLFCVSSTTAQAQTNPQPEKESFEQKIPPNLFTDKRQFLTFTLENDKYSGQGTDKNYTNGVRLTYFNVGEKPKALAELLDKHVPLFTVNETTSTYYSVGQNLYTPENTRLTRPDPDDRPYAAFLYGSMGLVSISNDHIDDMEATIGIVGPWALGKQTQKFVHETLNKIDPKGWDSQLENEPGLILSWQRRWPEYYASEFGPFHFRAAPHLGVTAGNVYTYANTGLSLQLTPKQFKWQSQPLRVRPSIPGPGFFAVPENKFAWSLFAGTEGRAIARNIFLDGNTFRDSPSVDKKHFVADLNAGLSTTYGRTQISYTLNWRSEEFHGQDDNAIFGAISVGYRF